MSEQDDRPSDFIAYPHDKAFKTAMSDIRVAKDFFSHYLSEEIKSIIDLDKLNLENGSFIDDDFKTAETDILYRVGFRDKPTHAYLYLLAEHLSKPDRWTAFRIIKYQCRIADQYLKQNFKVKNLPIIIPVIFYNGDRNYSYSTSIFDLFAEHKELVKELYLNPFKLVDLNHIPDEELRKHYWSGLMEMVMKHAKIRDVLGLFKEVGEQFIKALLVENCAESYVISMINYTVIQGEARDALRFFETIKPYIKANKTVEKEIMTIAEQLKKLGRQEGIQTGIEKGYLTIIKNLYHQLKNIKEVANLSGLSEQEVSHLLNKDKADQH